MLKRRIERLEQRVRARAQSAPAEQPDFDAAKKLEVFGGELAILFYNDWRHETLSLEERLALANDDVAREHVFPSDTWSPGLHEWAPGRWVSILPDVAVRELSIRVLLHDAKITETGAKALRHNADAHFYGIIGDEVVPPDQRPSLASLPRIEFDEPGALASARASCPHKDSLSFERRIETLREDYERELQQRRDGAVARCSWQASVDQSLDAFCDKMYEVLIKVLEQEIRERDAATAPHLK